MKYLNLIVVVNLLISCSVMDLGNLAPGYREAFNSISAIISQDKSNDQITEELIKNIPYASAIISIGKGKDALMILESKNNQSEYTWVSQDGIYLVLRDGKIVKTAGLENNLIESISPDINYEKLINENSMTFLQYFSYDKPLLNNLKVETTITLVREAEMQLFNQSKVFYLIEERIKNQYLNWERVNYYWLDKKFKIQKGQQYISPKLPSFFFEITKKPAE
jgi:hypothetical protein